MLGFKKGALFAVFILFLCISFLSEASTSAADKQNIPSKPAGLRRVLLLNSYHQGYPWTDQIVSAVQNRISAKFPLCEFYIEFMDSKRLFNVNTDRLLKQTLSLKYKDVKLDVIVISDDNALDFMMNYHDELFPGVPVVFCGINDPERALGVPRKTYTGLIETTDERENIELILRLCPKAKKIYVISDATPTGLSMRKLLINAIKSIPHIKLVFLKGEELSTRELIKKLRKVEPENAVLLNVWFRDKTGKYFSQKDVIRLFTKNSAAPVFGVISYHLNYGILGGRMNSGKLQGNNAGKMAVRIMQGESPENIPVTVNSINEFLFSWPQLQRFSIDTKRLPPGSKITNQPFSFYETYKKLVWSTIGAFSAFLLLITTLTINSIRLQRAKNQLGRSEKNLETILNSIGDAVIAINRQSNIMGMNPVAEVISGWNKNEALHHNFNEVFSLISPEDHQKLSFSVDKTLEDETSLNINRQILQSRNGSKKLVSMGGSPIRNKQNETVGLVIVLRDVTEETALQNRLHQSERLQSVGMLAGGIAHDFNNMLVGIFGAAEVLSIRVQSEREKRLVNIILNSAKRASLLTSKLLVFSRNDKTEFAPSDINSVVKNTISLLEHTLDKKIEISLITDAATSIIDGDESQLQNALINIGINASHAMPNGGKLDISTRNIRLDNNYCSSSNFDIAPGKYIEIEIRDTGTGIPPEHINRIFEPFFTTKDPGKGTGLGLATVYGTVQSHHGAITVYSEVGTGTAFRLYFPVSEQDVSDSSVDEEPVFAGEGTILVVDDEEMVRSVAITILEEIGYKLIPAADGEEAVAIYKENSDKIDLIILDMIMPKLNGVDTFNQLKAINPDVKVLISSGFSKEGDLEKMKHNGVLGFIRKPYRRVELCRRVTELTS